MGLAAEGLIFLFFFFSISGWIGETLMESLVRRRFVSKGFFKGPYVPVHGVGALAVYTLCSPLKAYPFLVFLLATLLCTLIEYTAALLLEKVFYTKGWDYDTYPFTRGCHYKKRIALTTSLFFGVIAFGLIYFYWDLGIGILQVIHLRLLILIDIVLSIGFIIDAVSTGIRCITNKHAGIPNKTAGLE